MAAQLFRLSDTLYQAHIVSGQICLVKAGKSSPDQMSLFGGAFDESKHKRDTSGKFTSGGGSSSGGLPILRDRNAEPQAIPPEKKQEIKNWMNQQADMIANPDIDYDEETDEPLQTDEEWYRENLDPAIVAKMDELASTASEDGSYSWDNWGDINTVAMMVMGEKAADAMGIDSAHPAIDSIIEAYSMGEDW